MENGKKIKIDIDDRTFKFGIKIVKMVNNLPKTPAGFALGGQVVRSGTSVGANIEEAQDALSKRDFLHSMNIALKEARETRYWLRLIIASNLISNMDLNCLLQECNEIIGILTVIVRKTKQRINSK